MSEAKITKELHPLLHHMTTKEKVSIEDISSTSLIPQSNVDMMEKYLIGFLYDQKRLQIDAKPVMATSIGGFIVLCEEVYIYKTKDFTKEVVIKAGIVIYYNGFPDPSTRFVGSKKATNMYLDNLLSSYESFVPIDEYCEGIITFVQNFTEAMISICNYETNKKSIESALYDIILNRKREEYIALGMQISKGLFSYYKQNEGRDLSFLMRVHNYISSRMWETNSEKKVNIPHPEWSKMQKLVREVKEQIKKEAI